MNSPFSFGSRHRGQAGEHRADRPVVLHRRHVVVHLIRDHLAVRVQSDFDVRKRSRRLRRPLEVLGPHPLHADRLANGLRQDDRFVFRARISAVRSSVVARARRTCARRCGRSRCPAFVRFRRAAPAGSGCACRCARSRPDEHRPRPCVGPIGACFMNGNSYVAESFLAAPASAGATSPLVLSLFVTGVVFQSAFSQVARTDWRCQAALSSPSISWRGHLLRGADGFPLRRRNHSDQVAFHDHLRVWKAGLIHFTGGHQCRAQRLRMHHARMQHAWQPHIGGPFLFRRDLGRVTEFR